jgi:hypothetical protein
MGAAERATRVLLLLLPLAGWFACVPPILLGFHPPEHLFDRWRVVSSSHPLGVPA